MRQILVISGKGGTGKTIIAASFAALAKNALQLIVMSMPQTCTFYSIQK